MIYNDGIDGELVASVVIELMRTGTNRFFVKGSDSVSLTDEVVLVRKSD